MGIKKFSRVLGPGLIYAGAAVGVSHLVQSTRAGATYGFDLLWILLLANIIKYPFFEFAPRYVSATGNSLIEGYRKIGKWAIIAFALLTLLTMFAIQAAVTIVTAGLAASIFKLPVNTVLLCGLILGITAILLLFGKYAALDKAIKLIIIVLAISTIMAVFAAFRIPKASGADVLKSFNWLQRADIFFLIAFIGWMPSPIDVSVWSSLWSVEKNKQLSFKPGLKQSLLDFKIGYIGTIVLAMGFLALGAFVMYGSREQFSAQGAVFAGQLINMYTRSLGAWSESLISIAALTTMFSTTLTCLDAYPRVLRATTRLLLPETKKILSTEWLVNLSWMLILIAGTLLLLGYFSESMGFMVDMATTLSFVTAPILAYMNYRVVCDKHMPESEKPKAWLKAYAWAGIIFLSAFTLFFMYWRFII